MRHSRMPLSRIHGPHFKHAGMMPHASHWKGHILVSYTLAYFVLRPLHESSFAFMRPLCNMAKRAHSVIYTL